MTESKIVTLYDNLGIVVQERHGVVQVKQITAGGSHRIIAMTRGQWNEIIEATKEEK